MGKLARMRDADSVDVVKAVMRSMGEEVPENVEPHIDTILDRLERLQRLGTQFQEVTLSPEMEAFLEKFGKQKARRAG